jgi:hypothetical protein
MVEHTSDGSGLFPYDSVVGVVEDERAATEIAEDLAAVGISEDDIFVLAGEHGVERIDPKGKQHGLLGKIFRKLDTVGDEHDETELHVNALRAGQYVVGAHVTDENRKERARDVFARHNGHHVSYYTRWTSELLLP